MLDRTIIILVVAAALFFFVRSLYQTFTGKKSGCGNKCAGCKPSTPCTPPTKDKKTP